MKNREIVTAGRLETLATQVESCRSGLAADALIHGNRSLIAAALRNEAMRKRQVSRLTGALYSLLTDIAYAEGRQEIRRWVIPSMVWRGIKAMEDAGGQRIFWDTRCGMRSLSRTFMSWPVRLGSPGEKTHTEPLHGKENEDR